MSLLGCRGPCVSVSLGRVAGVWPDGARVTVNVCVCMCFSLLVSPGRLVVVGQDVDVDSGGPAYPYRHQDSGGVAD